MRAAELRSLTKAAEASHIGLAAASRRIALLEYRFKTSLFERSPRGVELTPARFRAARCRGTLVRPVDTDSVPQQVPACGRDFLHGFAPKNHRRNRCLFRNPLNCNECESATAQR